MPPPTKEERILGSLLGLAVGDALGTTVECMPPGSFPQVEGMVGGGKYSLLPGQVRFISPRSLRHAHDNTLFPVIIRVRVHGYDKSMVNGSHVSALS